MTIPNANLTTTDRSLGKIRGGTSSLLIMESEFKEQKHYGGLADENVPGYKFSKAREY